MTGATKITEGKREMTRSAYMLQAIFGASETLQENFIILSERFWITKAS
jgi:hypothetical protein